MPKSDQLVTNFAIYEDAVEYLGTGEVEFPEIAFLAEEIKGAGIAGNIEAIVIGHLEAMTATFNFNTVTDAAIKLTEPRIHNIDCRVAQQVHDTRTGKTTQEAVKHILRTMPKSLPLAKRRWRPRQRQAVNTLAIIMPCTRMARRRSNLTR